ncbi:LysR family transcriptional regulator [Oscillibacter sp. MSJ-2]|uniref:LysR family transcriptional regulator n=1 Tax=Dysosmobacter acutus TaxID=2841504 RepID=A0ABS6FAP7_9FIRM|nr:LysR family transcriptional regulator [Dysosmobacter acutus]MBU5627366.1 LysR family transcriptional regulator [Dysosmobacter acutus]
MDITKYEVLLRAVDCGSLTRAAEEMGYTQSGISHMMKSLETEFGFPLLVRGRSGVTLTKGGESILPYIRTIVNANRHLNQNVSELNGLDTGEINIGEFASISISWMPNIIDEFHRDYPNIMLHLIEGSTQELEKLLEENRLDFAFCSFQPHMHYDWFPLKRDPILAILPLNHPCANFDSYPISAFQNEPFVIPSMGVDYDIMRVLKEAKVQPACPFSTMDDYAAIAMVEKGLCVSLSYEMLLKGNPSKVAIVELDPPQYRTIGIIAPSFEALSPAARKFVSYAKRIVPTLP